MLILLIFFVSAVTPILIPFATGKDGNLNPLGYVAGAMFWTGLLGGILGYILLFRKDRRMLKEKTAERKLPPGLRFFSNPPASVMDLVMVIGVAGTIYCVLKFTVNPFAEVIFLWMMLTGIYAHFLLNGNMYYYIWNCKNTKTSEEKNKGKE